MAKGAPGQRFGFPADNHQEISTPLKQCLIGGLGRDRLKIISFSLDKTKREALEHKRRISPYPA